MGKYKLVYWELKEKNFNKEKTLERFINNDLIKIRDVYEMRKEGMYAVDYASFLERKDS